MRKLHLLQRALGALFFLVPLLALAQAGGTLTTVTGGHVWTQSGSTFGVGVLSDGGGSYATTVPPGTPASRIVGKFASGASAAGAPTVSTVENLALAGGRSVPVTVVNGVSKLAGARAIAAGLARFAGPLAIGMAYYDLAQQLDMITARNAAGELTINNKSTGITYGTTGWLNVCSPPQGASGFATAAAACDDGVSKVASSACGANTAQFTYTITSHSVSGLTCNYSLRSVNNSNGATVNSTGSGTLTQTTGTAGGPGTPATLQDLEDKIAQQSGWPDSAMRAMADAVNSGEKLSVDAPTVTGPATTAGPTTTTTAPGTDPVNGKSGNVTTTTTTNYNNSYQTNNVTVSQVDQSTRVWNYADATTRTETPTTTQKEPESQATAAQDPALPGQPTLYEKKYPNGPKGVWDTELTKWKATPLFALPAQLAPNLGDSGGCPKWSVVLNFGRWNYGTHDASIPCNVWTFMRLCMIIGALFLARRLIFGG